MTTSTTNTTTTTELNRRPTTTSTSTTSTITTMEGRDGGQGGWKWTQMMCRTRHLGLSESFFFLSSCILILTDVLSSVRVMVSLWWQTLTTAITTGQRLWPPPPPPTWSGFRRDGARDASRALFFFFFLHNDDHEQGSRCDTSWVPGMYFFRLFSFFFTHYILDIGVRNTNNYQRGSRHVCVSSPVCFFIYLCF